MREQQPTTQRQEQATAGETDPCGLGRICREVSDDEPSSKSLGPAARLHNLVREHPDFEVLQEPALYPYCFRYVPNSLSERQEEPGVLALLDRLNEEIVEKVRPGGPAFVMATRVGGRVAIRVAPRPHETPEEEIDATFEALARWGRLLAKSHSVRFEKQI